MTRPGTFDLLRDSRTLLEREWLRPQERLRKHAPTWRLVRFEGIPRPRPTAAQAAMAVGRFIVRIPLYLFLAWIIVLAMESGGGDLEKPRRRTPMVIVWGQGRDSRAGSLATPALRRRGIWALTDRRLAFLAVRARTSSKLFSTEPLRGNDAHAEYRPVPIETVAEFPADEWRYEGTVERTRTTLRGRVKPVGRYHRIVFADGSGVDLFRYR